MWQTGLGAKVIIFLILVLILLIPFPIKVLSVHAAPETVVKVDPTMSFANVSEVFTINIVILDVQNLYGVEVTLYWNASIVEVANVDLRLGVESHPDGILHEPIYVAENSTIREQGKYCLAATSVYPAPSFNGSGNIVRITFNATSYGNSQLNLESELYDYPPPDREPRISLPIEHTTIDGSFAVVPEYPVITILFLFMTSTLLIAISSRFFRKLHRRQYNSVQTRFISIRRNLLDIQAGHYE